MNGLKTTLMAAIIGLALTGAMAAIGQVGDRSALDSLIAAERAFARTSEEKGIREAFLTWLAADAVVFRPAPVAGRPVYEKMDPANPAVLTWEPEVAEVSSLGDLGWTSGPYVWRAARDAEPTVFGHYVSVWKKQIDGGWKVLIDVGVQHGAPGASPSTGEVATPASAKTAQALTAEQWRNALNEFGRMAASLDAKAAGPGLRRTLARAAAEDIRVYRPGKMPAVGRSRIKELVPAEAGQIAGGAHDNGVITQTDLSWSGDLAVSYGTFHYVRRDTKKPETTAFLRIWRKDATRAWKIGLDIELPVQDERPKGG